jgi:hypothetical protein
VPLIEPVPDPLIEPPELEPVPDPLSDPEPEWPPADPVPLAVPLAEHAARANDKATTIPNAVLFMTALLACRLRSLSALEHRREQAVA